MYDRLLRARLQATHRSVLLLGARQVGKSTLCRSLDPDVVINLADESVYLGYAKDPARLGREIRALTRPSVVLVDEVQRVPTLLNTVQALLDERVPHRFLLTGSSARKLKRGGANLLPGRVLLEHLDPLTMSEVGSDFDLERALQVGMLPGIYRDRDFGADILESYAATYLRDEIQAEAVIREIGSYARFLDVAAASSGDWISYGKLSSDAEIPKETIRRYFQVLEDTLVAHRVGPVEVDHPTRRVRQRDRFLLFDLGVRNALLRLHRYTLPPTERGRLFEQWVILECLAFIRARHLPWLAGSYRTDAGAEVDLVLRTPEGFIAIECKLGRAVTPGQLSGLRSFATSVSAPVRSFVVFQGERPQVLDGGVEAVPYGTFLLETLPELAAQGLGRSR